MSDAPREDAQGCRWVFTAYAEEDIAWIRESTPLALCVARETGSENGATHYQGYVKWGTNRRWSWWLKRAHRGPDGKHSLHWALAKGPEWKCRRYIVDVAAYMRDEPGAHSKEQGEVLVDFGCEVVLDKSAPADVRVVKAIVDGAALYQVFRDNPMHFYHNSHKIERLHAHVQAWREQGVDYKPAGYEKEYKRPRVAKDD